MGKNWVSIYVETSMNGPMKVKEGVSMWRRERITNGICTCDKDKDQGYIHGYDTTETELTLKALINALWTLESPQELRIYNSCQTVHNALQYKWYKQWQQDGWKNSYGKAIKYPQLWGMLIPKLEYHLWEVIGGKNDNTSVMEHNIEKEMERWKRTMER